MAPSFCSFSVFTFKCETWICNVAIENSKLHATIRKESSLKSGLKQLLNDRWQIFFVLYKHWIFNILKSIEMNLLWSKCPSPGSLFITNLVTNKGCLFSTDNEAINLQKSKWEKFKRWCHSVTFVKSRNQIIFSKQTVLHDWLL